MPGIPNLRTAVGEIIQRVERDREKERDRETVLPAIPPLPCIAFISFLPSCSRNKVVSAKSYDKRALLLRFISPGEEKKRNIEMKAAGKSNLRNFLPK